MNKLDPSWQEILESEFSKEYMLNLKKFLTEELNRGKIIYPHGKDIFNALNLTPFNKVKVVIMGQDPYHGTGEAHGLCFSVPEGVKIPPSLKNIYKEIQNDLKIPPATTGNLTSWAKNGVLLLNAVLTVEKDRAGSHRNQGWEIFTEKIIELLNEKRENLVFLLWGNDAKKRGEKIDRKKHLVLESAHPSPFSATRFFNNHHFSKTNKYLKSKNIKEIDWAVH